MNPLFVNLVDDAGLFPPTSLTMGDALARHAIDRRIGSDVLSHRFLCPTSRLDDLRRHAPGPLRLGLIVDTHSPPDLDGLDVEFVEVKHVPEPAASWAPATARVFVEVSPAALPVHVEPGIGLKVRCGGQTPSAFPTTHELGAFIRFCTHHAIPFKATAGLHHAVRHPDPSFGVYLHGFLNLLLAVCAAVDDRDPVPLLEVCDPHELVGLTGAVPVDTARRARASLISYGSCSTSAPLDDLTALGLIEPVGARA
ncbi:hypothetical protein [Streptosporangium sp. KLBMP 9127]|nr:hypothetical protein [Streptosporangium sp. KLBMP 9127]